MRDPHEGLTAAGIITTGAALHRIPVDFRPVISTVVSEFEHLDLQPDAELLVYGSVATGQARLGHADIDLVAAGVDARQVAELGRALSARFFDVCRGVEMAATTTTDQLAAGDEAYGNRVFLRHYCVPLYGPDRMRGRRDFAGNAEAARGFNGDIGLCVQRWQTSAAGGELGTRVARKTLLALAGLVSVTDGVWSTDRAVAVRRWAVHRPELSDALSLLLAWSQGLATGSERELHTMLSDHGPVQAIADEFNDTIGPWRPDEPPADSFSTGL